MLSQNKNRIAYLSALTLLFSYAEFLLPRFIPFFRLGLGNIAILLSFTLGPLEFLLLTVIKAVASCLISGTLFSPFFLISLAQSVVSGMFMYGLVKLFRGRLISVYGISLLGSACSAVIQIILSSLYLGEGTLALLGPMLLFSLFSGLITAWLSQVLHIPPQAPELVKKEVIDEGDKRKQNIKTIALVTVLLTASIVVLFLHNIISLIAALVIGFTAQLLSKRKIRLLPHISLWIFVILSALIVPQGKILFTIYKWNITYDSLMTGIEKALKLSTLSAFSQCLAGVRPTGNGILSVSLSYFSGLCKLLNSAEGNLLTRVKYALRTEVICE